MSKKIRREDALNYHSQGSPGKIEVVPTKLLSSQNDLALAYSPGVAEPCKEIEKDKENAYKYTAKGNLVGVISNGTAVLGLGDIGPDASKPVMEGKGVLFKKFAGIDVFDIEIQESDPEKLIHIIQSLEPTFGGINLEDIKAPECFVIEQELKKKMNIPVMHDDQHGTAIISSAALINALELVGKNIEDVQLVVSGAGAAAISCTKLYQSLGLRKENILMFDRQGLISSDRTDLDENRALFASDRKGVNDIKDAMKGADVFLGLSAGNVISKEHILAMAPNPIVFALANPDPEIPYQEAMDAREDIIMATGRSDHPNQVNNVIGFPYIFRGALDVRATAINEEMKLAAAYAIASLAKQPVPELINKAYDDQSIVFGRDYLIPKPLDPRLITTISPAVARAAMESGVAKTHITDWAQYEIDLQKRIGVDQKLMNRILSKAKKDPKRVVFAEADNAKILKAAQMVIDEGIAHPILLGNREKILDLIATHHLDIGDSPIIDIFENTEKRKDYGLKLYEKRKRKGVTLYEAEKLMRDRNYFGSMMVEVGEADAMISGLTKDYPRTIRPALEIIGAEPGKRVAGMYILSTKKGTYIFSDTTVNTNPTVDELVEIIGLTARGAKFFGIEPRMAMLSYSNFGSSKGEIPEKASKAREIAKKRWPDLIIDGDIQANIAVNTDLLQETYPFSELAEKGANTFIFPTLASGNIAYKLLMELGNAEAIGPILLGMNKPVHILQLGSSVREIVNMVAISVADAQNQYTDNNL
ncbi:NADP-dependent malic enzyme [Marivirga sp. S37H4]|uniref:NADP-dependent malic enzyme n=1 Tax=Marivirga aurantiaca TaxID=2802615 RepID=A0A935C8U7_9BACT|nr:NADP-dependent malic enzyme [Marivirga aurantiaca]MBK6265182.1 NADP-dependent malic enzyme [Marivirga aurantiaca]